MFFFDTKSSMLAFHWHVVKQPAHPLAIEFENRNNLPTLKSIFFFLLVWSNWTEPQVWTAQQMETNTTTTAWTLPVRPAAGGGAESESGAVDAVPGCAWRVPGRSQRQPGGWWVLRSPEQRAGWTKLLECQHGNPASQTTAGGSETKNRHFCLMQTVLGLFQWLTNVISMQFHHMYGCVCVFVWGGPFFWQQAGNIYLTLYEL